MSVTNKKVSKDHSYPDNEQLLLKLYDENGVTCNRTLIRSRYYNTVVYCCVGTCNLNNFSDQNLATGNWQLKEFFFYQSVLFVLLLGKCGKTGKIIIVNQTIGR